MLDSGAERPGFKSQSRRCLRQTVHTHCASVHQAEKLVAALLRVPELIPVLGSQHAGDMSHKPDGRLPLLFARPAVTPGTLKRAATNFSAW